MSSLDRTFSKFLKVQRGTQTYASFAAKLAVSESTLYRLINGQQSATLRGIENILRRLNMSVSDVFGEEIHRKRGRRG